MSDRKGLAPKVAFYADDFTGAVANLAEFDALGLRATLLPSTPSGAEPLEGCEVVGIAGTARSLSGRAFDDEVVAALRYLHGLSAGVLQYKLCSTFDSSPRVGNLGRVIELARASFGILWFPVVPADPAFGRYTAFSHHFANFNGDVLRLDRHPTMSVHPSTPMGEADLRRHLGTQTPLPVAGIDWRTVRAGPAAVRQAWDGLASAGNCSAIVLDTLTDEDLSILGRFLWDLAADKPTLVLGSQGIARGLARAITDGSARASRDRPDATVTSGSSVGVLVLSGSASQQSAVQIETALAQGWLGLACNVSALADTTRRSAWLHEIAPKAAAALASGRHVIIYSTIGNPRETSVPGLSPEQLSQAIGSSYAACTRQVLEHVPVSRMVVAGGDTSSHFVRALDVGRLDIARNAIADGLSQLRAASSDRRIGALELFLKAGQAGSAELYPKIAALPPG